jgi:hypothetical protein
VHPGLLVDDALGTADFDPLCHETPDERGACRGINHSGGFRVVPKGNQPEMKRTFYALLGWITWKVGMYRLRRRVRIVGR